jgi:hypothetical protein
MKAILLPFLESLLWFLERLPQKKVEAPTVIKPAAVVQTPLGQSEFLPVSRTQDAISKHLQRHWENEQADARFESSGLGFAQPAIPRHKRDWDLVNRLKRQGLL